jgi:hypothetical protein
VAIAASLGSIFRLRVAAPNDTQVRAQEDEVVATDLAFDAVRHTRHQRVVGANSFSSPLASALVRPSFRIV